MFSSIGLLWRFGNTVRRVFINVDTLPKWLKCPLMNLSGREKGKSSKQRWEWKKEFEKKKLKVACMLETNNGFHRQNWLLAWKASYLFFFLLFFLNCDTHPGLAAVAWGLLQRYNVCVLWVQSPGLQHWKKSSLCLCYAATEKRRHWSTPALPFGLSIHFFKRLITWKLTKPIDSAC